MEKSPATAAAAGGAGSEASPDEAGAAEDSFKAPPPVALSALLAQDASDASLSSYKASLLGAAADAGAVAKDAEKRRVVVHEMRIEVAGRAPIVVALDTPAAVARLEAGGDAVVRVKEGADYAIAIVFSVHQDVVLGLTFHNTAYSGLGIALDTTRHMLGSYPPEGKRVEARLPSATWPSGMFARGVYPCKAAFTDDDKNTHLAFRWKFEIRREWDA